jgi:hypothetical protein
LLFAGSDAFKVVFFTLIFAVFMKQSDAAFFSKEAPSSGQIKCN